MSVLNDKEELNAFHRFMKNRNGFHSVALPPQDVLNLFDTIADKDKKIKKLMKRIKYLEEEETRRNMDSLTDADFGRL